MLVVSLQHSPARARALAIEEIEAGTPIIAPSDTCYGFLADALNDDAVEQVIALKQRRRDRAFLIMVADMDMARSYVEIPASAEELAATYLPGPLTLVLPRRADTALIGVHRDTVGIRIPSHELSQEFLRAIGRPLVTTSANLSGEQPTYSIKEIVHQLPVLEEAPIIVLDDGDLPPVPPSTIVRVDLDGTLHLLREGPVVIPGLVLELPQPPPKKPRAPRTTPSIEA